MEKKTGRRSGVTGLLSERMLRTAAFVTRGNVVADVGCDHAYTSIYLVEQGIAPGVVAMDVNKGPLARAAENVERFGLRNVIDLRLSDGLKALAPGEADTILIAGMGGPLVERILTDGFETVAAAKELVLQPQSEIEHVRRFLHEKGFCITAEDMLREDGKYYVILRAEQGTEDGWSEEEYCFGKHLIEGGSEVLREYLEKEKEKAELLLQGLTQAGTGKARARQAELQLQLEHILRVANKL